jgi:phosphohistidine phosphatase
MARRLFLVRHEDAEPGYAIPDAHRGLTAIGRARMRKTAELFAAREGVVDAILTSPLVRAVQTAEILARGLGHDEPILARGVIADPPSADAFLAVADEVEGARRIAIVGHEPTLSHIAAEVVGKPGLPFSFEKGMIAVIEWDTHSRLRYVISGDGPTVLDGAALGMD